MAKRLSLRTFFIGILFLAMGLFSEDAGLHQSRNVADVNLSNSE